MSQLTSVCKEGSNTNYIHFTYNKNTKTYEGIYYTKEELTKSSQALLGGFAKKPLRRRPSIFIPIETEISLVPDTFS